MAKKSKARPRGRFRILIPVLATIITVSVLVISLYPYKAPAALEFQFGVSIVIENVQTHTLAPVIPKCSIGRPGGCWATNQFTSYGLDGNYPIYVNPVSQTSQVWIVQVRSSVKWNYTLGDLFAVWGEPLGNATLHVQPDGGFSWSLCYGTGSSNQVPVFNSTTWGQLGLQPSVIYQLKFSPVPCP